MAPSHAPAKPDTPTRRWSASAVLAVTVGVGTALVAIALGVVEHARIFFVDRIGQSFDEVVVVGGAGLAGYLLHELAQGRKLVREVAVRSETEKSARALAQRDPLTGLLNRRGLDELKDSLLNSKSASAVLLCDLDGFKAVNDTYGHRAGDTVLKAFAGRLLALSVPDLELSPIRLGGDEFVLYVSSASPIDTAFLARTVLNAAATPFEVDGQTVHLSASIGIALRDGNEAMESLLDLADDAMYEARRKGVPIRIARGQGQAEDDQGLRRIFEQQIGAAVANEPTFYAASIGINRFRELRRTLGHGLASKLFRELTKRLIAHDEGLVVDRLSFDVLGVVFTACNQAEAIARIERVRAQIEQAVVLPEGHIDVQITTGLAGPGWPTDLRMLTEQSQSALDEAWRDGRSLGMFDEGQQEVVLENIVMMADMRVAVRDDALSVHYQPKVRTIDGAVDGVEALVRWNHPTMGQISPSRFVPVAERTGNIRAMTEWVLNRVIDDRNALAAAGHDATVYVNVSAELIGDNLFAEALLQRLAPQRGSIGIEITETAMLSNPACALENLNRLSASGVKIAIDDYGVGLSSLAYLKQLPASELKLDMLFIQNLTTSHRDPMIVRSTIELAHGLGLRVTAEGVDSAEAVALLRIMGCDLLQGFHIARPMPLESLKSFLSGHDAKAFVGATLNTGADWKQKFALAA